MYNDVQHEVNKWRETYIHENVISCISADLRLYATVITHPNNGGLICKTQAQEVCSGEYLLKMSLRKQRQGKKSALESELAPDS
jgi:hypothetical protein